MVTKITGVTLDQLIQDIKGYTEKSNTEIVKTNGALHVFVYGTLKKGRGNNSLLKSSEFIGEGKTVNKYALYTTGIPFVIASQKVSHISGELYSVDDETLLNLDRLEGHPDWYHREITKVEVDGKIYNAYMYFYPKPIGSLIKSGIYV